MSTLILPGDCRAVLKTLPSDSVQCVVTSPPYWGLRAYLPAEHPDKHLEIGSEPTLHAWVDTMVEVFREVRRVLRPDGVLFLNLGDAYANDGKWGGATGGKQAYLGTENCERVGRQKRVTGLKPKDMMGQPWRVAFALQDDGWWLRQEIIWHKPQPMPESIRDRCTKAHEHVFLLTKSAKYFWNFDEAQEPTAGTAGSMAKKIVPAGWATGDSPHNAAAHQLAERHPKTGGTGVGFGHGTDAAARNRGRVGGVNPKSAAAPNGSKANGSFCAAVTQPVESRNWRSVWTIPTHGFTGAHFATFPPELARRCIVAGSRPGDTILDPFGGAGTVGMVADRLQRDSILIELDQRSVTLATNRVHDDSPLFADVSSTEAATVAP